jgi:uncharacterized Zn-binding protein involved in type VI secretion
MGNGDHGSPTTEQLVLDVSGAPPPEGVEQVQGDPGAVGGAWRTDVLGQVLGAVGVGLDAMVNLEQQASAWLNQQWGWIPWGPHSAVRVGDVVVGLPHPHAPPIAPFWPFGPVVRFLPVPQPGVVLDMGFLSGAETIQINGMPAARCGDMGVTVPFCLGFIPFFEIFLGSLTVWFEGQRAARTLDLTNDCMACDPAMGMGKLGACVTGSGDVLVGGLPVPSLVDFALGKAFELATSGFTRLARRLARIQRLQRLARRFTSRFARFGSRFARFGDEIAAWQARIRSAQRIRRLGSYAFTPPLYRTFSMRPSYIGEHLPFNSQWFPLRPRGVTYLDEAGRAAYRLDVVNGQLVDVNGNILSTSGAHTAHSGAGQAIVVMDEFGNIYSGSHKVGVFQHSSFLSGGPVAFAGEMSVENGVVTLVTNGSGHYRPPPEAIDQFLAQLQAMGMDVSSVTIKTVGG